ncbi:MAG: FAD-dependent oxidoreductase [Proteobacteria bacterium]|nr:FAD-dependent oxidoreductase [Pseudomonadota bacterium]
MGTSSKSKKMVHGGLRYMKEGYIQLTHESIKERERLVKRLPGLIRKKSYYLPLFDKDFFNRSLIRMGLLIYDLMAFKKQGRKLTSRALLTKFPFLNSERLNWWFEFIDAVTDDARLVYSLLLEGDKLGGEKLNYCQVKQISKMKKGLYALQLRDKVEENSFGIKAKAVINATGVEVNQFYPP